MRLEKMSARYSVASSVRRRVALTVVGFVVSLAPFVLFTNAGAVNSVLTSSSAGTPPVLDFTGPTSIPTMPTTSAPLTSWQSWATQANVAMSGFVDEVTTTHPSFGSCTMTGASLVQGDAQNAGYPDGVLLDGVSFSMQCQGSSFGSPTASVRTRAIGSGAQPIKVSTSSFPRTAPGAGSECEAVGGAVSYGQECIQPCTLNNTSGICATFTNQSAAFYSHVELSGEGLSTTQCFVGSLIGDTPTSSQAQNTTIGYFYIPNASSVYNSNDWKGFSSPYTNLGNVCAAM